MFVSMHEYKIVANSNTYNELTKIRPNDCRTRVCIGAKTRAILKSRRISTKNAVQSTSTPQFW